ncbi:PREDICTED: probable ATP-dependent RNA helicase DDX43 [Polistes dominula]|uniref:RNA helicase n=1 Tax=Polistes dominula TaxID=743375 RepID=A0ABM1ICX1_POLDO|nr:PREDICTED: probable ATP-dependent RNA helicase DDX43 [Polistes dominula]
MAESRRNNGGWSTKSGSNSKSRNNNNGWQETSKSKTMPKNKNYNGNSRNNMPSMKIEIDPKKVGKLIGKEGKNIKELQQKSNTRILVDNSRNNNNATTVTITGSLENQKKANELIEELLKDPPPQPEEDLSLYDSYVKPPPFTPGPIIKNFYKEDPTVSSMSPKDAREIRRQNNNIEVECIFTDEDAPKNFITFVPNPITSFEQAFKGYPEILKEIVKQGFKTPSPIQCQAWPILLSGKDMIGVAQTGTGKTLAFLLPALIHIDGQRDTPRIGPNVIILAPTRELALQIEKEVNKYSYRDIKAICIYGGVNRLEQIKLAKKENAHIVIATPGRLMDFVRVNVIDVRSVSYVVLDEADRMLDLGFGHQISYCLDDVRPDRQTVMTSATWPPAVRSMALKYMVDPIQVSIGSLDLTATHTVEQIVYVVEEEEKKEILKDFLLNLHPEDKVIVFLRTKTNVTDLSLELCLDHKIDNENVHSGLVQEEREKSIAYFENNTVRILLATDLVSRGIDIKNVTHVINYDFPNEIEEYVHRVGRTGRAGQRGVSITYMTKKDWAHAQALIDILEEAYQDVPYELRSMANRYEQRQSQRSNKRTNKNKKSYSKY